MKNVASAVTLLCVAATAAGCSSGNRSKSPTGGSAASGASPASATSPAASVPAESGPGPRQLALQLLEDGRQAATLGTLDVHNDASSLVMTFAAVEGYTLVDARVALASTPEALPQTAAGSPKVNEFPLGGTQQGQTATIRVAMDELASAVELERLAPGTQLYLAATATVQATRPVATGSPTRATVWAGETQFSGTTQARMFSFVVHDPALALRSPSEPAVANPSNPNPAPIPQDTPRPRPTPGSDEQPPAGPVNGINSGEFRTQTPGGWGATAKGANAAAYRDASFAAAFPNGALIGDPAGFTARFTTAAAVEAFLPALGEPASFATNHVDPLTTEAGVLAGQTLSLTLSVRFDQVDPNFGSSALPLASLVVADPLSPFVGMTVQQVLDQANRVLAGLPSNYTAEQVNEAVTNINQNFVDGVFVGTFLRLP